MPQAHGMLIIDLPPSPTQPARIEFKTVNCNHCNGVITINPLRPQAPHRCSTCCEDVCTGCKSDLDRGVPCEVFKKKLERWET
jgi:hypothetical protein